MHATAKLKGRANSCFICLACNKMPERTDVVDSILPFGSRICIRICTRGGGDTFYLLKRPVLKPLSKDEVLLNWLYVN